MTTHPDFVKNPYDRVTCLLTGVALFLVLYLHLLPALIAGFFVYEMVEILAPRLRIVRIRKERGRLVAVALLALAVILLLAAATVVVVAFVRSEAGSVPALLQKMAEVVDRWRAFLPSSVIDSIPDGAEELRDGVATALREHAAELQRYGAEAGRMAAHVVIGLVIGCLVALHEAGGQEAAGPLARSLEERVARLGHAFRRVVFAQARISALNTALTGIYLLGGLPIAGVHIPMAKTMVAVTFLTGMIPVVGNLVSNTIIVILSLSVSPSVAIASLIFLIVIHKLEYFLNARIIGSHVRAHAWELLVAMLVMEAAFGISGLIAAPIYYAYLKDELTAQGLV